MWVNAIVMLCTAIVVMYLPYYPYIFKEKRHTSGEGWAAPGWRKVADVFRSHLDSGLERGGAIAVYYKGEMVVEFSGGYADYDAHYPWNKDTLTQACSSAKGVAATVIAILVDRGVLNYTDPVAKYWPEFAENGKEDITLEQLLSHQAGLTAIDEEYSAYEILYNPQKVAKILAAQKPNWTPGEKIGYHGITLGLYLDQIVRRVDTQHRDLAGFFADEIARPYGIDFFFGLPLSENHRAARLVDDVFNVKDLLTAKRYWPIIWTFFTQPNSICKRSIVNPPEYDKDGLFNNPTFRAIPNPSSHGFGTAQGLAKFYGILGNKGQDPETNTRIISEDALDLLKESLVTGWDEVLKMDLTYGRGTLLRKTPNGDRMIGTPGAGGQMGYADIEKGLGWAYLTNYHSLYAIGDDPRYLALEKAIYESLEDVEKNR